MQRLLSCASLLVLVYCGSASAQQPASGKTPLVTKIDRPPVAQLPPPAFTPAALTAPPTTPELWVYSQEQRRHDDPAMAVRRKAEFQAEQRMARIASLKWYGYSNSRPECGITPIMGSYSAGWIGNSRSRYDWIGGGYWMY